ncbi:MAG: acyltransferase family protein [Syntrophobacteraceae bacterium]|nr:acyltransferase [Desulfobacteraceae bacterium]
MTAPLHPNPTPGQACRPAHQGYRPDIDGLRAVAILSVIGFHAKPDRMPGGFVGVDVFFVISGYLISGIILRGLKEGTFSFSEFYARRIKRIFPALSAVLVFVLAAGWYWLLSDEFELLGRHVATGAAFLANFTLRAEAGYFDRAAELKPLLHLWSLGIEEQFYIVWPLLLFVAWKCRLDPLTVMLSIFLVSFGVNVGGIRTDPVSVFYLPLPRFWELLMGGVLAYAEVFGGDAPNRALKRWLAAAARSKGTLTREAMAILGAALIGAAVIGLDRRDLFPGWWALLPTCGAWLLIAAGPDAWVNRTILSSRPARFLGLISYPLYLWHWPLLSFERILRPPVPLLRTAAVVSAVVLAWLTYRFVEKPVRSNRLNLRPAMALVSVVACVGLTGYLACRQQLPPRSSGYGLEKLVAASVATAYPGPQLAPLDPDREDMLQQGKGSPAVLFLGDSNIMQYYPRIDRLITGNPSGTRRAVFCTGGGCPPIPGVREDRHPHCAELMERGMEFARTPQVDTVVIGANWYMYFVRSAPEYSYYFDDGTTKSGFRIGSPAAEKVFAAIEGMVGDFIRHGKKVFLVLQIPMSEAFDPRHMIKRRLNGPGFEVEVRRVSREEVVKPSEKVIARLKDIAERTGAIAIDPVDWLCDGTDCPAMTPDGEPTHKDGAHLNPSYVRDYVHYLDRVLYIEN